MKVNPKKYGTVGVLLGGPSAEREISLKSGKAISRALRGEGITVIKIGEHTDIRAGIREEPVDLAFIALHGRFGEDGIQYLLEVNSIPGFTATSLLPQPALKVGIDFPALCLKLLDLALTRNNYRGREG